MQDALVGSWLHESHLSAETLGSLRDLNHRFLDLAATHREWMAGSAMQLSTAQRAAAADCPYALFDLRFQDDAYWRSRLQTLQSWRVADEPLIDDASISFVRLALFYAWHVATGAGIKAQLLLGMSACTAAALRNITVNQLPNLVITEAKHLSARWNGCAAYWNSLMTAAAQTDRASLRRVQLYGLQLAAAARLSHS